jgi:hypothetical protein
VTCCTRHDAISFKAPKEGDLEACEAESGGERQASFGELLELARHLFTSRRIMPSQFTNMFRPLFHPHIRKVRAASRWWTAASGWIRYALHSFIRPACAPRMEGPLPLTPGTTWRLQSTVLDMRCREIIMSDARLRMVSLLSPLTLLNLNLRACHHEKSLKDTSEEECHRLNRGSCIISIAFQATDPSSPS